MTTLTELRSCESEDYFKSSDYDLLSIDPTNRPINQKSLNRLIKKIGSDNKLKSNPLIVNIHGSILDGQHRFLAAKFLNVPYWFIIDETSTILDVPALNSARRSWKLSDYLHHYKSSVDHPNSEQYKKLDRLWSECFNVPLSVLVYLSQGVTSRSNTAVLRRFRDGEYALTVEELPLYVSGQVDAVYELTGIRARNLTLAIAILANHDEFSGERWSKKLEEKAGFIKPQITISDYVRCLQKVYNHNMQRRSRVAFERI